MDQNFVRLSFPTPTLGTVENRVDMFGSIQKRGHKYCGHVVFEDQQLAPFQTNEDFSAGFKRRVFYVVCFDYYYTVAPDL